MKTFWKDYIEMCIKPQNNWIKKHWKGYVLYCIASVVGTFAYLNRKSIVEKLKSKFQKIEESE